MNVLTGVNATTEYMMAVRTTMILTMATKKLVFVKWMLRRCSCVLSSIKARRNLLGLLSLLALLIIFLNFAPEWTG